MKQYTATANDDGVRLSRFVQSVTANFPNSLLYKSFRNKRIKVNGKRAEADYRLQKGDLIELYINDEFFPEKPAAPVRSSWKTFPTARPAWSSRRGSAASAASVSQPARTAASTA